MKNLLRIKFFDNVDEIPLRGTSTLKGSLINFKKNLRKNLGKWEYAVAYSNGKIHCYFHHSKTTPYIQCLDNEQYLKALYTSRINLYIVFKYAHKVKTGNYSGQTVYNSSIGDMPKHFTSNVEKILAYKNNKVIATYQDGKFL